MGLGIIVMLIGRLAPININSGTILDPTLAMERVYIRVVSGLVTGLLLLFVIHQVGRTENTTSPLAENIEAN